MRSMQLDNANALLYSIEECFQGHSSGRLREDESSAMVSATLKIRMQANLGSFLGLPTLPPGFDALLRFAKGFSAKQNVSTEKFCCIATLPLVSVDSLLLCWP